MPDDADPPVARLAARLAACFAVISRRVCRNDLKLCSTQRLGYCDPDRVELMVASDLFINLAATVILKDDEIPDRFEEMRLIEHAFGSSLKARR